MSLKSQLRSKYKGIKSSKVWQQSRIAAFFYPFLRLLAKTLVWIIFYSRHVLRVARHKYYGRVRRKLNRKSMHLYLARRALKKENWSIAKVQYLRLLNRIKNDETEAELHNEARLNISVIDRLLTLSTYKKEIKQYKKASSSRRKLKIAVFTAVSGGYDSLKLPRVLNPAFDYIFFTDTPARGSGIYDIRPMPYYHQDATRQARFVKTHPHLLLPGYDIAIWIDANIMILDDITPLLEEFLASKKPVAAIPHPIRKTIGQEARACVRYGKDDVEQIKEQARHYKDIGYETNELIESNIMMIDLRDKRIDKFYTTWWAEIDKYTRRDQLSLNYSLDTAGISWHRLMKRPTNARNHPLLTLVPHHVKQTSVLALEDAIGSPIVIPYGGPSFSAHKQLVIKGQGNRKIDIVYCVHNALEDVQTCLDSVIRHRTNKQVKLIIVDDGSEASTRDYLKDFAKRHTPWVKLLRSETASGYTKAANRGVKASSGELVILLNSDTIVTDGWTEKMADAVFSTPGAGIVGPLSSAASHQSIPNHKSQDNQTAINALPPGVSVDDMNTHCENWSVAGITPRVPLVHGFCFGITREVIDNVGLFDEENFPNGYGEENDYCFRAVDAGFSLVIATNTYVYHAKSKSYQDERRVKLMQQGNETLRKLRGRDRIWRAVVSMQKHPILDKMRQKAASLYS